MNARAKLKKLCKETGAKLRTDITGIHYDATLEAPEGHIFKSTFTHECVAARLGGWGDAFESLMEDASMGFAKCKEPDCEWCLEGVR